MSTYIVPVWENKTAPCGGANGCPAKTDIASALHALSRNDPGQAWRIMMASHPLRATLGRVCYAFCEEPCNRGSFDSPISIQTLEAIIGDYGFDPEWRPDMADRNGKRALIVGSGPAGLTAAWYLNLAGFETVIYEADEQTGGILRSGIPSYRLPREVLDREIGFIETCGVTIETGTRVDPENFDTLLQQKKFDAAVVCVGAGAARAGGFAGEKKTIDGLSFLRRVNNGEADSSELNEQHVVVIGGGNVAMDACRCAVRLGARKVTVVYRRTEVMAPAHQKEIDDARDEGVFFTFLRSPVSYDSNTKTVTTQIMRLGQPDESGRSRPEPTGETEDIRADMVIVAVGQESSTFNVAKSATVNFAGDVIATSEGTVIHAIAAGKEAAAKIVHELCGKELFTPQAQEVPYDKMNVDRYFEPKMRMRLFARPASLRVSDFDPVEEIPSLEEGIIESDRCFRCGLCIGGLNSDCDWCFRACGSKGGVTKHMVEWNPEGPLFTRDEKNCDTCGACWDDCPRYVVTPVEIKQ